MMTAAAVTTIRLIEVDPVEPGAPAVIVTELVKQRLGKVILRHYWHRSRSHFGKTGFWEHTFSSNTGEGLYDYAAWRVHPDDLSLLQTKERLLHYK